MAASKIANPLKLLYSTSTSRHEATSKKITAERLLKLSRGGDGQGTILFTLCWSDREKSALMSIRKLMRGTRQDRPVYALQLVHPVVDGDSFQGLLLLIGAASEQLVAEHLDLKCAYIAYVHAVKLHQSSSWSGSELVMLGVEISRLLGMDRVRIHDSASVTCSGKPAASGSEGSIMLSDVMVLTRGVTLYSRLGFRPVPGEWDSCLGDASIYAEKVSQAFRIVETVTVGELRDYCKRLIEAVASKRSDKVYLLVRTNSGCGSASTSNAAPSSTEFRWRVDPDSAKLYFNKHLKSCLQCILNYIVKIPDNVTICDCLAQAARSANCADLVEPLMFLFEPVDTFMTKRINAYNWRFNQVQMQNTTFGKGPVVVKLRGMDQFYDLLASRVVVYEMIMM